MSHSERLTFLEALLEDSQKDLGTILKLIGETKNEILEGTSKIQEEEGYISNDKQTNNNGPSLNIMHTPQQEERRNDVEKTFGEKIPQNNGPFTNQVTINFPSLFPNPYLSHPPQGNTPQQNFYYFYPSYPFYLPPQKKSIHPPDKEEKIQKYLFPGKGGVTVKDICNDLPEMMRLAEQYTKSTQQKAALRTLIILKTESEGQAQLILNNLFKEEGKYFLSEVDWKRLLKIMGNSRAGDLLKCHMGPCNTRGGIDTWNTRAETLKNKAEQINIDTTKVTLPERIEL